METVVTLVGVLWPYQFRVFQRLILGHEPNERKKNCVLFAFYCQSIVCLAVVGLRVFLCVRVFSYLVGHLKYFVVSVLFLKRACFNFFVQIDSQVVYVAFAK